MIRFAVVGVVNTAVYYGLYLIFHLVVGYLAAHTVAFVLAMVASYFLNAHFTFRIKPSLRTFLLFPLSNLANYVFTTIGLKLAVDHFGLSAAIAPIPVVILAVPVTYIVAHYVMLGNRKRRRVAGHSDIIAQE